MGDEFSECVDDIQLVKFNNFLTFDQAQSECEALGVGGNLALPVNLAFFGRIQQFLEGTEQI